MSKVPDEVDQLARARSAARSAKNWIEADRLRAEIEAAGWKVVDRGVSFRLEPAQPPDLVDGERTRYGASASVPTRLSEPADTAATIVIRATDWPDDVGRALASIRAHAPERTQVVVAADAPSAEQELALASTEGPVTEVVWTSQRLGHAASLNVATRRARGSIVIVLDPSVEASGDFVTPLVDALDDPTVAVAGGFGLRSTNLRQFEEAEPGDVVAIEGYVMAFRRDDFRDCGPFDEHFRFYRNLDIWWSLVLRDEGEGVLPRRAVVRSLPVTRHEHRGWVELPDAERDRLSKRNFYRIIDRFGRRLDLASPGAKPGNT
jgi:GT2 family glycosyltransferase